MSLVGAGDAQQDVTGDAYHYKNCDKHQEVEKCYSRTNRPLPHGAPCPKPPKFSPTGFLPVCGTHKQDRFPMGNCKAIEDCGFPCERRARYCTPYHLCEKHEGGTATLLTPLLDKILPIELWNKIFADLFPKEINRHTAHALRRSKNSGIFNVHPQISYHATRYLFANTQFEVVVTRNSLELLGCLYRKDSDTWDATAPKSHTWNFHADPSTTISRLATQHMKHIHIHVHLDAHHTCNGYVESKDLYNVRDTMNKLVKSMMPDDLSKHGGFRKVKSIIITVSFRTPSFGSPLEWDDEQKIAATFLAIEPLRVLKIKHFRIEGLDVTTSQGSTIKTRYLTNWNASRHFLHTNEEMDDYLGSSDKEYAKPPKVDQSHETILEAHYKIEKVVEKLTTAEVRRRLPLLSPIYSNMERFLYLAHIALEAGDQKLMSDVQEALTSSWVTAVQQMQTALQGIAGAFEDMLDHGVSPDLRISSPDAFTFPDDQNAGTPPDHLIHAPPQLIELEKRHAVPIVAAADVTVTDKLLRVVIKQGSKQWIRLKTPQMIRELRNKA